MNDITAFAKKTVVAEFDASGMTKIEFARNLGTIDTEIRRILEPGHHTKIRRLEQALAVFGKKLIIEVVDK